MYVILGAEGERAKRKIGFLGSFSDLVSLISSSYVFLGRAVACAAGGRVGGGLRGGQSAPVGGVMACGAVRTCGEDAGRAEVAWAPGGERLARANILSAGKSN
jgi:hypothetical protein